MDIKKAAEEARLWIKDNLTVDTWALMRLDLMEDYAPEELKELVETGRLEQELRRTESDYRDEREFLAKQGMYESEINDVLRGQLIDEYINSRMQEE